MTLEQFFDQPGIKPPYPKIKNYHVKWFRSFGFAYWCDRYTGSWSDVVDLTHNFIVICVRIQIKVKKTTVVTPGGNLKRLNER